MIKPDNQKLISLITAELNEYESVPVYLTDKVKYNTNNIIKQIIQHQNDSFEKESSKKRFFFNIGNSRVDTAVKKIDFDTKDVLIDVEGSKGLQLLLQAEMRQYLKNSGMGVRLNNIVEQFPDIGNVIAKKINDERIFDILNPVNFKVIDQTVEDHEDTANIEEHRMNATQLRRMSGVWDNIDIALETCNSNENGNVPEYYVYERYGEMSLADYKDALGKEVADGDSEKFINTFAVVCVKRPKKSYKLVSTAVSIGVPLFIEEVKPKKSYSGKERTTPYKVLHWGAYQNRWWRKGFREALIPYQNRVNILGNQIYQALKWSQLHVLWSPDQTLAGKNIFKAIENGDIIQAEALNILPLEERNLAAQVNEWNRLMDMADRECQAFEVATGEKLPSGTTLGQVEIQTASVGQYFDFKREKLGLFLEEIFNDWVLPDLMKKINSKHILEVTGDARFIEDFVDVVAENRAISQIEMNGGSFEDIKAQIKTKLLQEPFLKVEILDDTYKNVKARVKVVISGESLDRQNKINNGLALLNLVQEPQAREDIIIELANTVGFRVGRMKPQEVQQPVQANQQMKI